MSNVIRLVKVRPYGSEGYMPVKVRSYGAHGCQPDGENAGCPLWHYYNGAVSCISASGDSLCGGYIGHANHSMVRCTEDEPIEGRS